MTLRLATLLLLALPALAQDRPDADRRIADLERRLESLSRELEAQRMGAALPGTPEEGRSGQGAGASKVYAAPAGLSVGGYAEFLYEAKAGTLQDGTRVGSARTADALRTVLYTGYKFTDRIVFNSEVEFEHGGYSDEHPAGEAVVEFAYLDFLLSRGLSLRAGQMLVPVGFINELHEPPAFLGARRPEVERALIPATWHENGVGIHGELGGGLAYRAYLMNGLDASRFGAEGIRDGRQAGKEAKAQSLAWTGRLDWTPRPGLLVGAAFYTGNSNQGGTGAAIPTTLWEAHAEFRARGLQVRGLYTRTTLGAAGIAALPEADPARAVGTRQGGGYLEAGWDLLGGSRRALVPYLRWERLDTQQEVVAGTLRSGAGDRTLLTAGAAWKPIPQVAVKADWTRGRDRAGTGRDQISVALGCTF